MTFVTSRFALIASIIIFSTGCAIQSAHMRVVPPERASYTPNGQGEALMIFMRPAGFVGGAIQSSVFDISGSKTKFIGIVSGQTKVAYRTTPGEHLFMVIAENADFMKADLESNKTYYALVTPRAGAFKARFSLRPVHKETLSTERFSRWESACRYVENTPDSHNWAKMHQESIEKKKSGYMKKWNRKDEADKATLLPEDGV